MAAAAKAALVGTTNVLSALPGLAGVQIAYNTPTRDVPREVVYGGDLSGPVSLSAMRGSGRVKREESLSLRLHVRVNEPGNATTQNTDARAVAICTAIEDYIAANTTLGGVTNLLGASVESVSLDGWIEDEGATSILDLSISLKSYLN